MPNDERIVAINDTAQTLSGLLISLTLAAATLLAIVFAATDQAIVRDSLSLIPQLGLSVPLSMITRVAPPVFLLLHCIALLQLNLLDRRIRPLDERINELRKKAPDPDAFVDPFADRLAGIAFFRSEYVRMGRIERSFAGAIIFLISVPLPFLTLLIFQIGFLRGQDALSIWIQQVVCTADFGLLIWFLFSLPKLSYFRIFVRLLVSAGVLFGVVFSWRDAALPDGGLDGCRVRWSEHARCKDKGPQTLLEGRNLIDSWICPKWGLDWCRQLNVENLALLNEIVPTKATVDVIDRIKPRARATEQILATIVGLDLRGGFFRYADFTNNLLYGANFGHAEMQGASFEGALLDYAQFRGANLEKAAFTEWREQRVSLRNVLFRCARLDNADFTNADLTNADLTDTDLTDANLTGATVEGADFKGAVWTRTKADGVDLTKAKNVRQVPGDTPTDPLSNETVGKSRDRRCSRNTE